MEVIKKDYILINTLYNTKEELFTKMADIAFRNEVVNNKSLFVEGLNHREKEFSTCIGQGVAIPHCRNLAVCEPAIFIIKNTCMIQWDDEQEVNIIILLAVPETKDMTHIKLISSVARKFVKDDFVKRINEMTSVDALYDCFYDITEAG